jgi:Flp pilus assembly pilin Flp
MLWLINLYLRATARTRDEDGQSTAEYALVIVAVVALVGLLMTWVNKSGFFSGMFSKIGGLITHLIP